MTYVCFCCVISRRKETCPCVFSTCGRCKKCLKCCFCPEKHARTCGDTDNFDSLDTELDDPAGPFSGLTQTNEKE